MKKIMKKIMKKMASLAACAAVALGLASCGGELHDLAPSPLGIAGLGQANECAAMTIPEGGDGSVQTFTFTWSSDFMVKMMNGEEYPVTGGWGGSDGLSIKFELPTDISAKGDAMWTKDYGGPSDEVFTLAMGADYVPLLTRTDSGVSGAGPSNIILSGLVDGSDYTIYVQYDSASEKVSAKISGVSSDPAQFRINFKNEDGTLSKNFPAEYLTEEEAAKPADEQKKTIPIYAMKKQGHQYVFNFVALYDEKLTFTIENDLLGTVGTSTYSFKKDGEYKIKYNDEFITDGQDADDGRVLKKGDCYTVLIYSMKKSTLISNLGHDYDFYAENGGEILYPFYIQAPRDSFEISIQRFAGDDSMVWASTTSDKSISVGTTGDVLAYVDNRGLENIDGKKIENFKATSWYPVKLTGLTKDKWYAVKFQGSDEATVKLEQFDECGDFAEDLTKFVLAGAVLSPNWNAGNTDYAFKKNDSGEGYSVVFTASAESGEFAVVTSDWGIQIRNASVTLAPNGDFTTPFGITGSNSKMSGLTVDKEYKLTVVGICDGVVKMKLEEVQ